MLICASAGLLGACSSSSGAHTEKIVRYIHRPAPASVTKHIVVARLPHVGVVLVDGKGFPVYAFLPESKGASCKRACLTNWPLYRLLPTNVLDTSPALPEALLSISHAPEGGRAVAYSGWQLHSYNGDRIPKVANGQGVSAYGGRWYLIAPDGNPVK
jgi:predicted lipoprotein with Yx(FWY)xxD motif